MTCASQQERWPNEMTARTSYLARSVEWKKRVGLLLLVPYGKLLTIESRQQEVVYEDLLEVTHPVSYRWIVGIG